MKKYPKTKLFEKLAEIEHQKWAHWQKYLHSKLNYIGENELVLDYELFKHWERQIKTDYKDLTEKEKDSDREQVLRYWNLITAHKLNIL